MSKLTVTRKGATEPRPSRIRREPPPPAQPMTLVGRLKPRSREWEIRVVLIGVVLFAIAFFILSIGISDITSH